MSQELRPTSWDTYSGQERAVRTLRAAVASAAKADRMVHHTLISGPPGTGKTTLAGVIRNEYAALGYPDAPIHVARPPFRPGDFLRNLEEAAWGFLVLDEAHGMTKAQQEEFLPLLEGGNVRFGNTFEPIGFELTVIATTTEPEKLIQPFVDRMPLRVRLERLDDREIGRAVSAMEEQLGITLLSETWDAIGTASAGVPRIAKQMVLAAQELESLTGKRPTAAEVLDHTGIDADGLRAEHREYMTQLIKRGGVAGLDTLEVMVGMSVAGLRTLEKDLLERNLIALSGRGRELTPAGRRRARACV